MEGLFTELIDWPIFLLLLLITVFALYFVTLFVKDYRPRWMVFTCIISVFFYSGIGIAYQSVDNKYIPFYALFVFSFCVPFLMCRKTHKKKELSNLDILLIRNLGTLEKVAILYLVTSFIPLVYPDFKLFNEFFVRDEYWESLETYRTNTLISIIDTIGTFIKPFFFAYLMCYAMSRPKGKKHLIYFSVMILFSFMRLHYLARNSMATYLVDFFLLMYCVKGFDIVIKRKHLIAIVTIALLSIPLLYAQTFFRHGEEFDSYGLSYMDIASLLFNSEFYYPIYYDDILLREYFTSLTGLSFILYVLFLPIPSALWPSKPTLKIADTFTYGMFGLSRGDVGFSIALPSAMGESFMYFGLGFSWFFALFSGAIVAFIVRYLCKHRTMTYYLFYLVIQAFTYGRGGTASLLPPLINGIIGIVLFEFFMRSSLKSKKEIYKSV